MAAPQRNRLIGAVHAAKKATDLDEETYRAMLARLTGKSSARDLSDFELRQVLDHMNGGRDRRSFAPPKTTSPTAKKARALWICLYALGAIDDPS
jgi:phage gp16-like protein